MEPHPNYEPVIPWDANERPAPTPAQHEPEPEVIHNGADVYQLFYRDADFAALPDAALRESAVLRYGYRDSMIGEPMVEQLRLNYNPGRIVTIVHH